MASDVGIVNRALTLLGQKPIALFSENNMGGQLATRDYADTRDEMLQGHPWNFAMRRAQLAINAVSPVFGFAHAYDLPEDYLRVVRLGEVGDCVDRWKVEARQILSDWGPPLPIVYIARIPDANMMSPLFREALSRKLAWTWAPQLTGGGGGGLVERMAQEFSAVLGHARSIDGQEGIADPIEAFEWLDARW